MKLSPNPRPAARRVAFNEEVTGWAIRAAREAGARGRSEDAARWTLVACQTASAFGLGRVMAPEIEDAIASLAVSSPDEAPVSRRPGEYRVLHVLSKAYAVGGHTTLVRRWVDFDTGAQQHHLALTFQERLTTGPLSEAIRASGGRVTTLGHIPSLTDRARALRRLAHDSADMVVLHTHMWDVVAPIAFAARGGPPVLLLNHADHAFWVGTSAIDAVINLRPSGEEYSRRHRGIHRNVTLPVPIPEAKWASPADRDSARHDVRAALGIAPDAMVALTIGSEYKYVAVPGLDFMSAAREIVARVPSCVLVAVGPSATAVPWQEAHAATGGRMMAVGVKLDLPRYHAAADLYIEGFPFGSATAMLEAAASGLAIVRAPLTSPPPFTTDGIGIAAAIQPRDVEDYVAQCTSLLRDARGRQELGGRLAETIRKIHAEEGWRAALASLRDTLPPTHEIPERGDVEPAPAHLMERWAELSVAGESTDPLWFAKTRAEAWGLMPLADPRLAGVLADRRSLGDLYQPGRIARLYPAPLARIAGILRRMSTRQ